MCEVKLFHNDNPTKICLTNDSDRIVSITDYIKETCPSLYGPKAYYKPTSYLFNGHLQTGYAAYYNYAPTANDVVYERYQSRIQRR